MEVATYLWPGGEKQDSRLPREHLAGRTGYWSWGLTLAGGVGETVDLLVDTLA